MMCKNTSKGKFLTKVIDGTLYSYLYTISGNLGDPKNFKEKVFKEVFFGKNFYKTDLFKIFEEEFPDVAEFITKTKKKDYRLLSKVLMKVESYFVIERIIGGVLKEKPDNFISTIHDSFLLLKEDTDTLLKIIDFEFQPYGIKPSLKVVDYEQSSHKEIV